MWTKLLWFSSESFYTSQCKRIEDTSVKNLLIKCFMFDCEADVVIKMR